MMIDNNENGGIPELEANDMFKVLWCALGLIQSQTGATLRIDREALKELPVDCTVGHEYDADEDKFIFTALGQKKRKRGIAKPQSKLILPSRFKE